MSAPRSVKPKPVRKSLMVVLVGHIRGNARIKLLGQLKEILHGNVEVSGVWNFPSLSATRTAKYYPKLSSDQAHIVTVKQALSAIQQGKESAALVIPSHVVELVPEQINQLVETCLQDPEVGLTVGSTEPAEPTTLLGDMYANRLYALKVLERKTHLKYHSLRLMDTVYAIVPSLLTRNLLIGSKGDHTNLLLSIKQQGKRVVQVYQSCATLAVDCTLVQFYHRLKQAQQKGFFAAGSFAIQRLFLEFLANPLSLAMYGLLLIIDIVNVGFFTVEIRLKDATRNDPEMGWLERIRNFASFSN